MTKDLVFLGDGIRKAAHAVPAVELAGYVAMFHLFAALQRQMQRRQAAAVRISTKGKSACIEQDTPAQVIEQIS